MTSPLRGHGEAIIKTTLTQCPWNRQLLSRCDCSLCIRRGAVLSSAYIPAADFTPYHGLNDLGVYRWNEKVLRNYFCKSCGIFTYIGDGENAKDGYRVNLGCVEGIDLLALKISIIDGKSLPVIEDLE